MKHLETILAGVMAASLVAPIAPVMATVQKEETVDTTVVIQTAQDFIDKFAKHTVTTIQPDGTETSESVFYTEVDRDNYSTILSGKAIYETLSEEMRAEIDKIIFENTTIQYSSMIDSANAINAEVVAEQEEAARLQAEQEVAQEEVGPTIEEAPEEVKKDTKEDIDTTSDQEKTKEVESMTEESNQETTNEDTKEAESSQNEEEAVFTTFALTFVGPVATVQSASEEEIVEPIALSEEEIVASEEQAALFTTENELVPQQEVQEEVDSGDIVVEYINVTEENANVYSISTIAQSADSGATDEQIEEKFVETYCKSNDTVYKTVTSGNYLQIISGYEDWQNLTLSQKTGVNKILTNNGSSTYTKLYNAAQALNGNSNTSYGGVHTSVSTNAIGYGLMSGISAAVIAFLFRKRKI